ncbi:MAG: hypothetical protein DRQ39_03520 [Gammaproteobacteria bacterium]|nr:MAG: hypothetical protein DRQ39_03520 [Gammaproteobacteria bacterium]
MKVADFEKYILTAESVGKLKGKLEERERSRDELKALLDAMQDELDLMRERAVRAETELRAYKVSMKQIDGLRL